MIKTKYSELIIINELVIVVCLFSVFCVVVFELPYVESSRNYTETDT